LSGDQDSEALALLCEAAAVPQRLDRLTRPLASYARAGHDVLARHRLPVEVEACQARSLPAAIQLGVLQ